MYSCGMNVQYIPAWFKERIIIYVCGVTPTLEVPFVAGPLVFLSFFSSSFFFLSFSFFLFHFSFLVGSLFSFFLRSH